MAFTQAERAEYQRKRKAFLAANPWCQVSLLKNKEKVPATHVHHRRGRKQFYLDESTYVAVSKAGDDWIHTHKEEARALGLLE